MPGPQFRTVTDAGSAEASYYVWVDWFDTFGLGRNVPIVMGNLNNSIYALVDGELLNLRVPLPDRHVCQKCRRAYRRPERRLERQGPLDDDRHAYTLHNEGGREARPKAIKINFGRIHWRANAPAARAQRNAMFIRPIVAAVAISSFLTAIGPNAPAVAQSNDVRFVLDFLLQGQQSAFVLGRERGYYSAQKINLVAFDPGRGGADAITKVASGTHDIGFGDLSAMIEFNATYPWKRADCRSDGLRAGAAQPDIAQESRHR